MSLGLILFSLADSQVVPNFDYRGYIMILMALIADAVIGNVQEKTLKLYGATNSEMVSTGVLKFYLFFRFSIRIQLALYIY